MEPKKILRMFESQYTGDPSQTMAICALIAKENGLNPEEVADCVYINRYADQDKEADELDEMEDEDDSEE